LQPNFEGYYRQFDEGGDIGWQRARVLPHVRADRRAQGRPDPLAGRRTGQVTALGRLAQPGVALARAAVTASLRVSM
jgi:hypothetical protein